MKIKKNLISFLALSIFISNTPRVISLANTTSLNRYETLQGEFLTINNSTEGELHEIEIFGKTVQNPNNLQDIQSIGDLYTDEKGKPILDSQGREQYKIDIVSNNQALTPIKNGLVSWVDAKYGKPGDKVWKDISGNNNHFDLIGFTHDNIDGFNGKSLKLSNTRKLKVESKDYIKIMENESYSLEIFFDGEVVDYLIGLQNSGSSSGKGSFICTFGSKERYAVAYDSNEPRIDGCLNGKNNHVVLIKDAENDNIKVYLNSALIYERDIVDGENGDNQKVQLGSHGGCLRISSMDIYSHRRYNKALTEAEIKNNYEYEVSFRDGRVIENTASILLPTQLNKVGNIADRLYWDKTEHKYIIEKNVSHWKTSTDTVPNGDYGTEWELREYFRGNIQIWNTRDYITDCPKPGFRLLQNSYQPYFYWRINKITANFPTMTECVNWYNSNSFNVYTNLKEPMKIDTNIKSKLKIKTYNDFTNIFVAPSNGVRPALKITVDRIEQTSQEAVEQAVINATSSNISVARMFVNQLPDSPI